MAAAFGAHHAKVSEQDGNVTFDHTLKTYILDRDQHLAGASDHQTDTAKRRGLLQKLARRDKALPTPFDGSLGRRSRHRMQNGASACGRQPVGLRKAQPAGLANFRARKAPLLPISSPVLIIPPKRRKARERVVDVDEATRCMPAHGVRLAAGGCKMLRGKFKRTVACAIGAWVAQACLTSSTVAQQEPKRGGTLVFGINSGDPRPMTATSRRCFPSSTCSRHTIPTCCASTLSVIPTSSAISPTAGRSPTT